jgi:ribose transport system substrate-binding protein
MIRSVTFRTFLLLIMATLLAFTPVYAQQSNGKKLVYLVSDLRIPFWDIMKRGIENRARELGYELHVHSAENGAREELHGAISAIRSKVDGIILSPTNSSAAVTILRMAEQSAIPVVISDVGTESGNYVSYIASDNFEGSYQLGQILAKELHRRDWSDGAVGIVSIPQKRANGKARTAGFLKALKEAGITGGALRQQVDFSYQETYDHSRDLIENVAGLRAIWLQGSDRYKGALDAIADAGKTGEVLLICFDAEPEFIDMIQNGTLVGAGMQQPFLMGEKSVDAMHAYLNGKNQTGQNELLQVLAISQENIEDKLPVIYRNVLGQLDKANNPDRPN